MTINTALGKRMETIEAFSVEIAWRTAVAGTGLSLPGTARRPFRVNWSRQQGPKTVRLRSPESFRREGGGMTWERRLPHEHDPVSYTHLRAHETRHDIVCRL